MKYSKPFFGPKARRKFGQRNSQLETAGFSNYADFLASDLWKRTKEKHYSDPWNLWCFVCGETRNLHVHHVSYRKIKNGGTALATVCQECHYGIHQMSKDPSIATRSWVRAFRERHGLTIYEIRGGRIAASGVPKHP